MYVHCHLNMRGHQPHRLSQIFRFTQAKLVFTISTIDLVKLRRLTHDFLLIGSICGVELVAKGGQEGSHTLTVLNTTSKKGPGV